MVEVVLKKPTPYPVIYDTWDEFASSRGINKDNDHTLDGSYCSCGISVMSGVIYSEPKEIVYKILEKRATTDKRIREAFVIFSDIDRGYTKSSGGDALCKYIKDNNLGSIIETEPRMNPNTGNSIKVWVWSPPHESLHPKDKYLPVQGLVWSYEHGYRRDPRFSENLPRI